MKLQLTVFLCDKLTEKTNYVFITKKKEKKKACIDFSIVFNVHS